MGTLIAFITTNWGSILGILAAIYGVMALIVKACPTLPDKGIWHIFLVIVKILGKITNNQTDDTAVRAAMK
jgi:hypothetical protein